MKNILCILLHLWPITRLLRRRAAQRPEEADSGFSVPIVLLETIANRQLVTACSPGAEAEGIHPGMTLAQARAPRADVEHFPYRPDQDAKGLEALARYMNRFTPTAALHTEDLAESDADEIREYLKWKIYLDLTGCEHLFHGLNAMVRAIAESLFKLRIPATLAVAQTPGAAFAIACMPEPETREKVRKIGVRTLMPKSPDAVNSAPLKGLRLDEQSLESLHHLGLETIGQLRDLPRKSLPARFGQKLVIRLDQLSGQVSEPLIPLNWSIKLEEQTDFDGSVSDPQMLEMVFQQMLGKLLLQLERRGHGLRELEVRLERVPLASDQKKPVNSFTLSVSRPSRNMRALLGLYRCAFDAMVQDAQSQRQIPQRKRSRIKYSLNFDAGFTAMKLTILRSQPLAHQQLSVDQADKLALQHAWQNTLDLIRTRLGEEAIQQAQLEQSYLPEKAYRLLPAGVDEPQAQERPPGNRPLHLHSPPEELKVMVAPSHDADGIPLSFSFGGTLHKVKQAVGPERIAGQWWEGHHKTRDYFDIADETGSRYWVFRVQETGKWFLHGSFE